MTRARDLLWALSALTFAATGCSPDTPNPPTAQGSRNVLIRGPADSEPVHLRSASSPPSPPRR